MSESKGLSNENLFYIAGAVVLLYLLYNCMNPPKPKIQEGFYKDSVRPCSTNTQCWSGEVCEREYCTKTCTTNSNCSSNEVCHNGLCQWNGNK